MVKKVRAFQMKNTFQETMDTINNWAVQYEAIIHQIVPMSMMDEHYIVVLYNREPIFNF